MSNDTCVKDKGTTKTKGTSRHSRVPPRNPNKKPTNINMKRSIGNMKANDRAAISRSFE